MATRGIYWLTVAGETRRLVSDIKSAVEPFQRGIPVSLKLDTAQARRTGQTYGRELQSGLDASAGRGGALGRFLRIDNAQEIGRKAGDEIDRGLGTAKVGAGLNRQVAQQMSSGNAARIGQQYGDQLGKSVESTAGTGIKRLGALIGGLAIGNAVRTGLKSVLDAGMEFENNLNTMGAVAGANAEQLQLVSNRARELGADASLVGASAGSAAEAMTELAKGGFSVQESMDAARGTLQLAAAAGTDASTAASIQSDMLHTFALGSNEAARAADILAGAANGSSVEIKDIAQSMAAGGSVANGLGVSLSDTATTIGLFANMGIKGSDAGTSMKTALLQLTNSSKPVVGAFEELGVKAFDASGNFIGMRGLIDQLNAASQRMTTEQYQSAAATAFGTDGVRFAMLAAQQGAAGFDQMSNAVNRSGVAAEVAAARTAGLPGAWNNFKNQMDGVKLALYDKLQQPLAIVLNYASSGIEKLMPVMERGATRIGAFFERLGPQIKSFASAIGAAFSGKGLTEGSGFLSSLGDAARELGPALSNVGPAIGNIASSLGTLGSGALSSVIVPGIKLLGDMLKWAADNASWLAPILGGTLVAIGGLKVANSVAGNIGQLGEAMRNILTPVTIATTWAQVAAMRAHAAALTQFTAAQTGATVATNAGMLANARARAGALATAIATRAQAAATAAATLAQRAFSLALLTNPVTLAIAGVVAAGVALWAFFTKTETGRRLWTTAWNAIKNTASSVWNWIKTTATNIWAQIGPGLTQIGQQVRTAFGVIGSGIRQVWQFIQPAVAAVGRFQAAWARTELRVAGTVLRALGTTIGWLWRNVAVPAFRGIGFAVSTFWQGAKVVFDVLKPAIEGAGNVISWLWRNVAVPAFNGIKLAVTTWWDSAKVVWSAFSTAIQAVGDKVSVWKTNLTNAFNAVKEVAQTLWNTVKPLFEGIKAGFETAGNLLSKIPGVGGLFGGNTGGMVANGNVLPRFANGGRAGDGMITGPGTGTSDSILGFPAMVRVANGEWLTNAQDTQRNLPLLQMVNAGVPVWEMLKALPRFAGGGLVSANQLSGFAQGVEGRPYVWGGVGWGDCSGAVSALANYATGRTPFGSRFATATESQELAARGFQPGLGPTGSLNVGWYNGGPGGGHTAATLPDGTNFEMGGKRGNGQFGGAAAGANNSMFTNHAHLPPEYFSGLDAGSPTFGGGSTLGSATSGGGGGVGGGASSSALSASGARVSAANTAVKNADQSVDDHQYRLERAKKNLEEVQGRKHSADQLEAAQHRVEVAERELADATERQGKARDKAANATQQDADLRSQGGGGAGAGGMDGSQLGKTFVSGLMESIGLDGSVFSNPLEWPTVKSAMAGVNFMGGLLSGKGGGGSGGGAAGGFGSGAAESVGLGGLLKNLPGAPGAGDWTAQPGSPKLAPGEFNPATSGGSTLADGLASAMTSFVPQAVPQQQQQPANVDNSINLTGNVGMSPGDVRQTIHNEQNARTRTTVRR